MYKKVPLKRTSNMMYQHFRHLVLEMREDKQIMPNVKMQSIWICRIDNSDIVMAYQIHCSDL